MKKSTSLKTQLTISFSIIILVLTGILSSVISLNSISIYRKEIGGSLSERVSQMSNKLDQYMWARYGELAARIGGDEFVVVVKNSTENVRDRGRLIADRIIENLSTPFIIENQEIRVGCSVGGAIWNIDSTDTTELTRMADQALYNSKRSGKGKFTYYSKEN